MASPAKTVILPSLETQSEPKRVIKQVRFWQAVHINGVPCNFVNNPKLVKNMLGDNVAHREMNIIKTPEGVEISYKNEVVLITHANIGSIIFVLE